MNCKKKSAGELREQGLKHEAQRNKTGIGVLEEGRGSWPSPHKLGSVGLLYKLPCRVWGKVLPEIELVCFEGHRIHLITAILLQIYQSPWLGGCYMTPTTISRGLAV